MKRILLIIVCTALNINVASGERAERDNVIDSDAVGTETSIMQEKEKRSLWSWLWFNSSDSKTNTVSEPKYVITRYGDGGIDIKCPIIEMHDGNYTIDGTYAEYYNTSNIVSRTIEYTNGICHGKQIEYYQSGLKKSETQWENGRPHGVFKSWYANGQLEVMGYYKDGKLEGNASYWHSNGQKNRTVLFKAGEVVLRIE
jgi:hypothetical protein